MNFTQGVLSDGRRGGCERERGRHIKPGKAEERFQAGQHADQKGANCYVHCLDKPVAFVSDTKASQSVTTADRRGKLTFTGASRKPLACHTMIRFEGINR
jgi:hypothetical protein